MSKIIVQPYIHTRLSTIYKLCWDSFRADEYINPKISLRSNDLLAVPMRVSASR